MASPSLLTRALVFGAAILPLTACSGTSGPVATTTPSFTGTTVEVAAQSAFAGPGTIIVEYALPDGYKVNDDAPSSFAISTGSPVIELATETAGDLTGTQLPWSIPVTFSEGTTAATFDVTLIYCDAVDTDLCLSDSARFEIPLQVEPPGASTVMTIVRGGVLPSG